MQLGPQQARYTSREKELEQLEPREPFSVLWGWTSCHGQADPGFGRQDRGQVSTGTWARAER